MNRFWFASLARCSSRNIPAYTKTCTHRPDQQQACCSHPTGWRRFGTLRRLEEPPRLETSHRVDRLPAERHNESTETCWRWKRCSRRQYCHSSPSRRFPSSDDWSRGEGSLLINYKRTAGQRTHLAPPPCVTVSMEGRVR